jgi:hypothetical protein
MSKESFLQALSALPGATDNGDLLVFKMTALFVVDKALMMESIDPTEITFIQLGRLRLKLFRLVEDMESEIIKAAKENGVFVK